jgi:hypothetical protein
VAFYSEALLRRGRELGCRSPRASVVYPPVADAFRPGAEPSAPVRARHGAPRAPLLLNVKRLHPLADHATCSRRSRSEGGRHDARPLDRGRGRDASALEQQALRLALGDSVRLLGLVPNQQVAELQAAADLFVLSSTLEATPTVALEALPSGTPVVSTDNPGGLELARALRRRRAHRAEARPARAGAALRGFAAAPRRTGAATAAVVEDRFRVRGVVERYLALYAEATA